VTLPDRGVLVVGAGQAGLQLACSLRDGGYAGRVTLVGQESHPPYQRPPLSKAFLTGASSLESLQLRALDFYAHRDIELVLGDRIDKIARHTDGSGTARCASGRTLDFTTLVLATGAEPRTVALAGAECDGVVVLRTIADAEDLSARLSSAQDVVVVGGGFIGLEIAATARALGKAVTVLEAASTLLGRAVGPVVADHVSRHHRDDGIRIMTGVQPTGFSSTRRRVEGVTLSDGGFIPADLVVVGVGARPRVLLAERLGLEVDHGIVVDSHCLASDGRTLAIGDCAASPDPTPWGLGGRIRLESVDNAVEQAKVAATLIMGAPRPYVGVPWFWSDQGRLKLQLAGLRHPDDASVVRRVEDASRLVVGHYRARRLVAVEAANAPADFMALRKILASGGSVAPEDLGDPGVALRDLAREVGPGVVSA